MRDRLLANWPLKALALALAFVIWVSITGQDRTLRDFTVPLEVDFGTERIAAAPPPTVAIVRLEGPQTTIRKLDPLRLAVRLDLHEAPLGEREVPLSRSHVTGVPRGVDVSLLTPERIRLVLVRRARRELAIEPVLIGEPAEGHAVYGFAVTPRTVVVEGPKSAVDAMHALRTEAIPLEGHTDPFVAEVGLVPEDPQVRAVATDDAQVEVLVDAAPVEAVFDDVPVEVPLATAEPVRPRPASVRVVLSGPPWLIERLAPTQISAVAEIRPPGPQRGEQVPVRVEVSLPEDRRRLVTVGSIRPATVSVQIRDRPKE
jgi:YbbR domain-containing protein